MFGIGKSIAMNPYKGCEILLLPKDILQELPIAKWWDDMDRVVLENGNICRKINEADGIPETKILIILNTGENIHGRVREN